MESLVAALQDDAPRVRFEAALALSRLSDDRAIDPLVALLEENDDRDVFLRHAAVVALSRLADGARLGELSSHTHRAVRLGAVLALRIETPTQLANFPNDELQDLPLDQAAAPLDLEPNDTGTWRGRTVIAENYLLLVSLEPAG